MKQIIICFFILLSCSSSFSQSDTVRWDKYFYIQTRLSGQYKYEYQDTTGNVVIPGGKYCYLSVPDEYGMINARLRTDEPCFPEKDSTEGYIDIHENILIPFHYSSLYSFQHNLTCAGKNGKNGYINRKGETVIPFLYDSSENFYDDGIVVIRKGEKEVVIDTLGNKIIDENHPYQKNQREFSL